MWGTGIQEAKVRRTIDDGNVEATVGFWGALGDALSELPAAIVRGPLVDVSLLNRDPWLFRVLKWDKISFREGFLFMAATLAFGGIYCIGWSLTFPSSAQRTLWRIASVSMTGGPIIFLLLTVALDNKYPVGATRVAILALILVLFLYIPSRLTMLVLPFLCLRSFPPATYYVLHWTSFIPHR